MRLLNARTGSLEWLDETANTPYAILSYLQDVETASSSSAHTEAPTSTLEDSALLSHLSPTIRNACRVASDSGYGHLWIQDYCVDMNDRTELSRTLNAAWDWHARAGACYVYLADVSPGNVDVASRSDSEFRRSSWHEDVWALQALIASSKLVFLARDWSVLGTKGTLAAVLEEITGVDRSVLSGAQSVHDVSVARRMWWASKRRTPSVEDCAYALLGIFGVEMSIEYGEGPRAFLRLQEEVFRRTLDQSLFAWHYHLGHEHPDCLFAPSPCCFARSGDIRPISYHDLAARLDLPADTDPPCVPQLTSEQLSIRLPLIPHQISSFPPTSALYEVFGVAARFSDVAILQCEDAQGRLVVLTLNPPPHAHSGNEFLVRAVETTLGQCDRAWSYCPVLYREAVQTQDIVVLRRALRSPWLPPPPPTSREPHEGGDSTALGRRQTQIILEQTSRARLTEQGFGDPHYATSARELIDDLYARDRRARRFVDVHEITVNAAAPREEQGLRGISVDLVTRRHSLAPVCLDRARVRYTLGDGRSLDATCLELPPGGDVSNEFAARYAIHLGHGASKILRIGLSSSRSSDSTGPSLYFLSLNLDEVEEGSERVHVEEELARERMRGRRPSPGSGRVMEAFPKLPSIRGWTTRGVTR
ncbi:hypothetical protein PYCCODRAFT_1436801 [Trametes coccinea BRFM310]|uniref:Heterokaryon incompatibility domain-containing protein n=1 Tax=Trametes coccinea (strain BRFM310) TaxID=1353009 RepID=A0A1Y2ILE6_TRAC3|nr:hypothetical protein PYCCODRAFT_1436801 [Trametes coccinea BRFM310]